MVHRFRMLLGIAVATVAPFINVVRQEPPTAWVDKDTGHRVIRLDLGNQVRPVSISM